MCQQNAPVVAWESDFTGYLILARWIKHFPTIRFIPFVHSIIEGYIVRAVLKSQSKENPNG